MDELNTNPAPQSGSGLDKDVEENKLIAAISYISILCLVGLFGKKDSPYVQFHAKQGFVLFVIEVGLMVVMIVPILGWFIGFFGSIAVLILAIMGIINALGGKRTELPVVGEWGRKVNF